MRVTIKSVRERAERLGFELHFHKRLIVDGDCFDRYELVKDRGVYCGVSKLSNISAYLDKVEKERAGK